ncbi:AfsR/SARP family transcriptional regulator [Streptomyces alkaliterrae]|uniref:Transcriptional regulator n=1 Tax=Streptomyces alkaliterrae TaxID=2213162 RepID=A0A5P0YZU3_9ACTN|nr:AfsR/SARP family transcriptional regulator [Streptomyces alkaliterrae]MBB1255826.1 AfsR/SARP family transcriptional regulator [Streptomyces alkaliterrae]MBB1261913.1 AfsR/SARP family transcriptional regulator [Streptomyces alkaliterrae]MQS04329.1 transcriptional regulator [Streptomyces alkaliterrae]
MRASTCQVPHLDDRDHALRDDRSALHFGVLGPLTVGDAEAGEVVAIAPKMRTVLALLVSHADQVVPTSVLIRELWDDSPPASGLRTLQTYILNCRKLLRRLTGLPAAELSGQVLVTQAGGYGFRSHGGPVDWMEYQRLTDRGTRAVAEGDDTRGIRLLDEALALWRGPAFVDVPTGPVLESRRRLFEESRLSAIVALAETRIRAGLHHEVIGHLAALTSEHAFHEGLHAQYMRALALSGRRAQALEVFSTLRTRLVTEIGLEPGYPLQQLQLAILNSHTHDL